MIITILLCSDVTTASGKTTKRKTRPLSAGWPRRHNGRRLNAERFLSTRNRHSVSVAVPNPAMLSPSSIVCKRILENFVFSLVPLIDFVLWTFISVESVRTRTHREIGYARTIIIIGIYNTHSLWYTHYVHTLRTHFKVFFIDRRL